MQSILNEAENGATTLNAPSNDKLDDTLVAQAIACLDMEQLRSEQQSYVRSYPPTLDPKPSDALDRLGVVLASTQLRIVGQTCTPKEIHVMRLSPNTTQLDVSIDRDAKGNSRIVVANLGGDAQVGCVWYHEYPQCTFSGRLETVDCNKFRTVRCISPSQLTLRVMAAFPMPSLDDSDAKRKIAANKQALVMFVFCHNKLPKPTPVAAATNGAQVKRKITSKATGTDTETKDNDTETKDNDTEAKDKDSDDDGDQGAWQESWISADTVKTAVSRQREKLRAATGKDLAALKALAVERNKTVEEIITGVSWWVLGRESNLVRSLGSFMLTKPYDWLDVMHARLPIRSPSRRRTQTATDINEAILKPYVSNIFTVLINNVGLVPQWAPHREKLVAKYRGVLKKHKVAEFMGKEPFADALADECTAFAFQKAFSFAFGLRMLRYITVDQLVQMSPAGVLDAVRPYLDEYLRCKSAADHPKAPEPSPLPIPAAQPPPQPQPHPSPAKRKLNKDEDKAEDKVEETKDKKKKKATKKISAKKNKKKSSSKKEESSSSPSSSDKDSDDDDAEEEEDEEEEEEKPKKKKKRGTSGKGKDKAVVAASKTASKSPVDPRSSSSSSSDKKNQNKDKDEDDDDDDQGTMVMAVMPSPLLQHSAQQHVAKEEYAHLLQAVRKLIKSGDEKQIAEYDWVAAAEKMNQVRPRFNKLSPAPSNLSTALNIEVGPKVLKVRPVQHVKAPLSHVANKGVQQFMSNVLNAEGHWDVLKVAGQHLPSFEAKDSYLYQFAEAFSSSSASSVKDQAYAVELQYHPKVHRVCVVGLFKAKDEAAPKAHRLLGSSLFAEVWYIGPLAALEVLKLDIDRIPEAVATIEDA